MYTHPSFWSANQYLKQFFFFYQKYKGIGDHIHPSNNNIFPICLPVLQSKICLPKHRRSWWSYTCIWL